MAEPRPLLLAFSTRAPSDARRPWDRWDTLSVAISIAIAAWFVVFKLKAFYGLGNTSDLFHHVQVSRSLWQGRPYGDNELGDFLASHVSLIEIPIGLVALPFGAPGLLVLLSAVAGVTCWSLARVLRALDVPGPWAVAVASALSLMPKDAIFFYHPTWGYAVELFAPALSLWLLHALLHRRLARTFVFLALLLSVKEEFALLAIVIALMAIVEEELGEHAKRWASESGWRGRRVNRAALATIGIALAWIPICLIIIKSRPIPPHSLGNFNRMPLAKEAGVTNGAGLVKFCFTHVGEWLASSQVKSWPFYVLGATIGLAALRPHFLAFGIVLTGVSWLLQDQMLWPPRWAPSMAFAWCTAALGLASAWRLVERARAGPRGWLAPWILGAALAGSAAWCSAYQLRTEPQAADVYRMTPYTFYRPESVRDADFVFDEYVREGKRDEPAIASIFLFRYAHDRELLWAWALEGKPRPVWILWDDTDADFATYGLAHEDYETRAHRGRFTLYKRRAGK